MIIICNERNKYWTWDSFKIPLAGKFSIDVVIKYLFREIWYNVSSGKYRIYISTKFIKYVNWIHQNNFNIQT